MEDVESIQLMENMLRALADGGFVVSGELTWTKPKQPGRATTDVTIAKGPIMTMVAKTRRVVHIAPATPTGDICFRCGGSDFQVTGTCKVCLGCGESAGCS